jgi:hypothetical protein
VEADFDSSTEDDDDDDDAFHWLGPEDDDLSFYVCSQWPCIALPTAAFPLSMSCVMTAQ